MRRELQLFWNFLFIESRLRTIILIVISLGGGWDDISHNLMFGSYFPLLLLKHKPAAWEKRIFFFWVVSLSNGIKIFSKLCCKQMCCCQALCVCVFFPSAFVVLFQEHRQNRFNIILKGSRSFGMVNEHWCLLICISL